MFRPSFVITEMNSAKKKKGNIEETIQTNYSHWKLTKKEVVEIFYLRSTTDSRPGPPNISATPQKQQLTSIQFNSKVTTSCYRMGERKVISVAHDSVVI